MVIVPTISGQDSPEYKVSLGDTCELTNRYIEQLAFGAIENQERVFAISRPGKDEKNKISDLRLKAINFALIVKGMPETQFVIATGRRTSNRNSVVEFYLGSKFFLLVPVPKGYPGCFL